MNNLLISYFDNQLVEETSISVNEKIYFIYDLNGNFSLTDELKNNLEEWIGTYIIKSDNFPYYTAIENTGNDYFTDSYLDFRGAANWINEAREIEQMLDDSVKEKDYKDLLMEMKKLDYKETLKAVFSFETGIEDENYLESMAEYFIESDYIDSFLDEELYNKQLEYYHSYEY